MSAQHIIDTAPLGALIRFSDGTPRPPDRFSRKLADWENRNGVGRLIRKSRAVDHGHSGYPASFALHLGSYRSDGIIVIVVTRHFLVTSSLHFEIAGTPSRGSVRVLTTFGDGDELRHLAPDMASAEAWLAAHHQSNARFDIVPDLEQGRTA
jgi:hypothetical protein